MLMVDKITTDLLTLLRQLHHVHIDKNTGQLKDLARNINFGKTLNLEVQYGNILLVVIYMYIVTTIQS